MLDVTDLSKPFGQKLNDTLNTVIDFEFKDFQEMMWAKDYAELTDEEHQQLYDWSKILYTHQQDTDQAKPTAAPVELLEKCPHPWAQAYWLICAIEEARTDDADKG